MYLTMYELTLSSDNVLEIKALTRAVSQKASSAEQPALLNELAIHAHCLPRDLRAGLNTFRLAEPSSVCLIRGFPIDDRRIGATPSHWQDQPDPGTTLEEELFLLMCGALLGDPVGWATQQAGHIVHNVLPIRGREETQVGWSSRTALMWHTEDAFHPYRNDYVMLMCLRNPDRTATTYAASEDLLLGSQHREVLSQPRFLLRPDDSHLEDVPAEAYRHLGATADTVAQARALTSSLASNLQRVAVMNGSQGAPHLRLDPFYMEAVPDDETAACSLAALFDAIGAALRHVALVPGEVLIIDNFRCVHGRDRFIPRYDGSDRWLKRINVTRDLRKSRAARLSPASRIIF